MASLKLTYDNEQELSNPVNVINIDFGRQEHTLTAVVDGSENINHFAVSCTDSWITVKRLRNNISLVIAENTTSSDRFGRLLFTHNLDSDKHMYVMFMQAKPSYAIHATIDEREIDSVEINTLLGYDDDESETVSIDIECEGGLGDYMVRSVVEYARQRETDGYRLVPYDNGIKVVKASDHELQVMNFGKISKYNDMYYEVILAHRNDFNTVRRIKVRYSQDSGSGFEIDETYEAC